MRTSTNRDMDSHFLWELIHLRSQVQRRTEKVYVLSNRYESNSIKLIINIVNVALLFIKSLYFQYFRFPECVLKNNTTNYSRKR